MDLGHHRGRLVLLVLVIRSVLLVLDCQLVQAIQLDRLVPKIQCRLPHLMVLVVQTDHLAQGIQYLQQILEVHLILLILLGLVNLMDQEILLNQVHQGHH
jgi:hypothetical protein